MPLLQYVYIFFVLFWLKKSKTIEDLCVIVNHREEDVLPNRRLTQHPGGMDPSSSEHS